jgi:hypothetical protein
MLHIEPVAMYEEGRNQRLLDFILSPPPAERNNTETTLSSFRAASAIPKVDRPWIVQTYWLLLHPGDGNDDLGVLARLVVDHPEHKFAVDLPGFNMYAASLPPPPNMKPKDPKTQTFWDRLLE